MNQSESKDIALSIVSRWFLRRINKKFAHVVAAANGPAVPVGYGCRRAMLRALSRQVVV